MDKELLEAFRADNLAAHAALDKISVPHPAAKLAIRVSIVTAELQAYRKIVEDLERQIKTLRDTLPQHFDAE